MFDTYAARDLSACFVEGITKPRKKKTNRFECKLYLKRCCQASQDKNCAQVDRGSPQCDGRRHVHDLFSSSWGSIGALIVFRACNLCSYGCECGANRDAGFCENRFTTNHFEIPAKEIEIATCYMKHDCIRTSVVISSTLSFRDACYQICLERLPTLRRRGQNRKVKSQLAIALFLD